MEKKLAKSNAQKSGIKFITNYLESLLTQPDSVTDSATDQKLENVGVKLLTFWLVLFTNFRIF